MKNILLTLLLLVPFFICLGQRTEVSIQVSSGLSFYGGQSASSTSTVTVNDTEPSYMVAYPYSKKSNFSYGMAIQVQQISSRNLILGLRAGYDQLSTTSHFNTFQTMVGNMTVENGKVILQNNMLQANPYFGYRLSNKSFNVDFTAGFSAGSIIKSRYTISFDGKSDPSAKKADNYYINTKIDLGPTAGLAAEYNRIGVNASYYYGLVNYMKNRDYLPNAQVYSRYLRFGISYRIK